MLILAMVYSLTAATYTPQTNWDYNPTYTPGFQQMSDDQLNQSVKDAFTIDYQLRDYSWAVFNTTTNSVVTLTGYVPTQALKTRFEVLAKRINGVRKVINNIQIKSSPTSQDLPPPNPMPAPPQFSEESPQEAPQAPPQEQ